MTRHSFALESSAFDLEGCAAAAEFICEQPRDPRGQGRLRHSLDSGTRDQGRIRVYVYVSVGCGARFWDDLAPKTAAARFQLALRVQTLQAVSHRPLRQLF
jgi:hypothetical protein